jgi:hypothetical protein
MNHAVRVGILSFQSVSRPFVPANRVRDAGTISRWCKHYDAILDSPKSKDITSRERKGLLREDVSQREVFVKELLDWIFVNADFERHFYLDL